jgi:hypothetical protein
VIGGRRFLWARARAARAALTTLFAISAVAALLALGTTIGLRAVEAADVRAALSATTGDAAEAVISVAEGDPSVVAVAVRDALAGHGARAATVSVSDRGVTITPSIDRFSGDDVVVLGEALRALPAEVRDVVGTRIQLVGGLETTLTSIAEGLQDRRGPTAVAIGILGLITVIVVGAVALEPVRSRAAESLLLRARGARTRSLGAATAVETFLVAFLGAIVGAGVALGVGALTGQPSPGLLFAAAVVVVVALAATGAPVLVAARTADLRSTRAEVAAFAGAAVVLAVVTGLAAWQFAQSGTPIVPRGDGAVALDPLVAIAPALLLALAALVAVLLATPVARAIAAATSAQRGPSPVTPLRLASRRPARHALPIAVVAFAVGAATVAGAYTGSVRALGDAPEALRVGADLRVITIPETTDVREVIAAAGDVDAAMPVRAFSARGGEGRIPVLAAQAGDVGSVMLDAGGTIDPVALGAAIRPAASGIPLAGDSLSFVLSTPQPPEEEWEGEPWQPPPTSAVIAFTFVADTGELWTDSQMNGTPVEEELGDGTTVTNWTGELDYRGTVALPAGAWNLAAVDVSLGWGGWSGPLTLHDVSSGGEAVDVSVLVPAPGTPGTFSQTEAGAQFQPEAEANDLPATRAVVEGMPTSAPVVMTSALAASLSLTVGDTIALEFDNPDFEADVTVAALIPVLPGSVTGEGVLADAGTLALLSPRPIVANQAWFSTEDAGAAAAAVGEQFSGPTVLVADPRAGRAAAATSWGFVLAAAGAAVLAVVVLVLRRTRTRADARELALLAVFGLGRARAARLRVAEDLFALAIGVAGGIAAGAATAWLIVPSLVRAAYGTVPESYPVPLAWPWLWVVVALAALVGVFAAVIASVRAPRSLAGLLREDE